MREDHFYALDLDVDKKESVHESLAAFITPEVGFAVVSTTMPYLGLIIPYCRCLRFLTAAIKLKPTTVAK